MAGIIAKGRGPGRAAFSIPNLGTMGGMKTAKDAVFPPPITLRTHLLARPATIRMPAKRVRAIRLGLGMSREFFARCLQVSGRTLEKWEQGETIPNDQAAVLILMVRKYPDTLKRLNEV